MSSLRSHHNARYAKLHRQRNIGEFDIFDNIFVERWIRRLATVGNLHIASNLCRACEKIIHEQRRYLHGILNTDMNETRRGYHTIRAWADKVVMFEIGTYRRNQNVMSFDFSLCTGWKCVGEPLYATKFSLNNRSSIDIVNCPSALNLVRRRRIKICKFLNFHRMAS